jgi:hypothetical protein
LKKLHEAAEAVQPAALPGWFFCCFKGGHRDLMRLIKAESVRGMTVTEERHDLIEGLKQYPLIGVFERSVLFSNRNMNKKKMTKEVSKK